MIGRPHTAAEVLADLRAAVAKRGQRAWCRAHLVPESTVSLVLGGQRDIPESVANALGYVARPAFFKVEKGGA